MLPKIPKEMRAVVYRGVDDLRVEVLPVPEIESDEILVRVTACGVCPTDIKKIHYGTVPPPRIFGHETAGTIVEVGSKVQKLKVGDRVGLHHHIPCLKCHACAHRAFAQCATYKRTGITAGFEPAGGGYAEYVRVMPFVLPGVVKIPRGNSFLDGAMLEPVNTVLKAIRLLHLLPGDLVLVAGQGPIGLMFTRLLSNAGMRVVASDLLPRRLELAKEFGAEWAFRADDPNFIDQVGSATQGVGLDAAVIAVPSDDAVRQAQQLLRGGGEIVLFAHTKRGAQSILDLSTICVDEKQILGSYSADFTLQKEVAKIVFSGQLNLPRLITHQFPLEQTAEAVKLAAQASPDALKIVVTQP